MPHWWFCFVPSDSFPSCYPVMGYLSCGRRFIARFPCLHICQFSFDGKDIKCNFLWHVRLRKDICFDSFDVISENDSWKETVVNGLNGLHRFELNGPKVLISLGNSSTNEKMKWRGIQLLEFLFKFFSVDLVSTITLT